MAQPTGTFSSYDAVGNREDLSDMIWNIDPSETPILGMMKKVKAKGTYHEWQTDGLTSPSATNAHVEGDDASPSTASATTRLGNYTQILKKHVVVTGSQEAADKAGRRSEKAYQLAKRMKEIKTDLESSMIGANNARVAGNDSTAREMASLQTYLTSNTVAGSGGSDATGDGTDARTDGTQAAFTESMLTSVLSTAYGNGADPKYLVTGAFNKGKISSFTGNATKYHEVSDKQVVATVDVYVGDFHELKVLPSRHVRTRDVLALDPEYLAYAEFRPLKKYDLAKTGDSERMEIVMEGTLEVCNEAAHCGIFDLTTS